MNENEEQLVAHVSLEQAGNRVDQAMAQLFADFSRSRLTEWIKQGRVLVDGKTCKPKDRLLGGEEILLNALIETQTDHVAQDIPLNVIHDDEQILVINKPAGLVVHPAAGNHDGTLLNALLFHYPEIRNLPRGGIVHRLDKDTTGLMVVAKTEKAHKSLVEQLQARSMGREYLAVVTGVLTGGGYVDEPIGRHPTHRIKMAVHPMGKPAITHYRVLQRYTAHTLVGLKLETGRTHQIRVHMAHLHYPLVGDPLYAGRARIPAGVDDALKKVVRDFPRQALHAQTLTLMHPDKLKEMSWSVEIPTDMQLLIDALEQESQSHG